MTIIRVKDHSKNGILEDTGITTETATIEISPRVIDNAYQSEAGRLLLKILKDIDYAGRFGKPVLLQGRMAGKEQGFRMRMVLPVKDGHGLPPSMQ